MTSLQIWYRLGMGFLAMPFTATCRFFTEESTVWHARALCTAHASPLSLHFITCRWYCPLLMTSKDLHRK